MTRGTRGICTGCGTLLALTVLAGCMQTGQSNQQTSQSAQAAATPVQAAADVAGAVVNTATGAVTGAVSGAVGGAQAASGGQAQTKKPRIKPNGRGGYDASELQQAALKQAHAMRDRYGVIDRSKPTTRPTTQPANR